MPRFIEVATVIVLCGWLLTPGARGAPGEQSDPVTPLPKVWYASALLGTTVKSPQGVILGTITDLVLDSQEARLIMVVISVGGFWGLGARHVIVPWWEVRLALDGMSVVVTREPEER
jgi:sporulation protein YlmC with PRC-barrel domain